MEMQKGISYGTLTDAFRDNFQPLTLEGKFVDRVTGRVAAPYGQDAGEPRYLLFTYALNDSRWYVTKKTVSLPHGCWVYAMEFNEQQIMDLAIAAFEAAK